MPKLRFHRMWMRPILDGRKTQTLRRTRPSEVWSGTVVDAEIKGSRGPFTFARLEVLVVEHVPLDALDAGDARREAVELPELVEGIQALYPGATQFVRVIFRLVEAT